jgi:hypothetical protein
MDTVDIASRGRMHPALTEVMTQAYQEEKPERPSSVRDQTSRNLSDRA